MSVISLRHAVLVLAAAAALACSSDDDSSGDGSGGSGGTGQTGEDPRCIHSRCPAEPTVYTKESCDAIFEAPCLSEWQAWNDCTLSNEECGDDGKIIRSSIDVCDDARDALDACQADL